MRFDDGLFYLFVDWCFDCAHEACAHVNAFSAQGESGSESLTVGEAARGDEGDAEGLARARKEDEICDVVLADMAGAFEAG